MSILFESDLGYFVSHQDFIRNVYQRTNVQNAIKPYELLDDLFNIKHPYIKHRKPNDCKKRKREEDDSTTGFKTEVEHVENIFNLFHAELIENGLIDRDPCSNSNENENNRALKVSDYIYRTTESCDIGNVIGENSRSEPVSVEIQQGSYIFPEKCKFYCSNVSEIMTHLGDEKFDVILLDSPWWNKYIRRKKMKSNDSYSMMFNDDLKNIPIEKLIKDDGIIVMWCTNSISHLNYVKKEIFNKWNVMYLGKWYWIKVTTTGEPICNFTTPPGKQPFEQIVFASRCIQHYSSIPSEKLIVSIPSALHSHKPPLQEILQRYVPENAKCLEIFARYLLPGWTSYGLEAIRFQHLNLYKDATKVENDRS